MWQYGYTRDGNAVYNALSAYKIHTDLLDAGCVTAEKLSVEYKQSVTNEIAQSETRVTQAFTVADSVLFDNLTPRTFKYVDGGSGRTHYGYIVDELKSAMDIAGLSSEECAAYCLTDISNPDGDGGIRYDELAVLATHELQKLKKRVAELEKQLSIKEE